MGRRAKFQAPKTATEGAIHERGVDALLGREDDHSLTWHVSRREILDRIRTVEGIAELAKVSLRTVRRQRVPPNSLKALQFVRDRRREMWRPLVSSSVPLDWRNLTTRYIHVLNTITELRGMKDRGAFDEAEMLLDPRPGKKRLWRRKARTRAYSKVMPLPPEQFALFDRFCCYYKMPSDKISVAQVCSVLRISRKGFEKWLRTVPLKWREVLRRLMLKRPNAAAESPMMPLTRRPSPDGQQLDADDLKRMRILSSPT
jgi:hypothetical protein